MENKKFDFENFDKEFNKKSSFKDRVKDLFYKYNKKSIKYKQFNNI
jgi:hypothetical protein